MTSKIELPTSLTVISKTEAVNRMVHDSALKQSLPVETLWGIYEGHLTVGWHVLNPERSKTVALWAVTNNVNCPIQAYRSYLVAQQMKIVSRTGLGDLVMVFHTEEVEGSHESETRLLRDLGPQNYSRIRTAVDPQFERNLHTITEAGVGISLAGVYAEVDAGRIIPTVGLRKYGIMAMAEREAVKQRGQEAITRWKPHFMAFAEQYGHGVTCVEQMMLNASYARWKGIEDTSLCVGLGILGHHDQHRRMTGYVDGIAEQLGAMLGGIAMVLGRPANTLDEDITQVSSFLAARFPGADAYQYASALADYWARLPNMPIDRSI